MERVALPLFPLGLVAFPGEFLNLHIFEPRYRQLITECAQQGSTFGIPVFVENEPLLVGTEMRLLEITKTYPGGEMDVKTQGLGVFKIFEFYNQAIGKLYPSGIVDLLARDTSKGNQVLGEMLLKKVGILYELAAAPKQNNEWTSLFRLSSIAHKIGLNIKQEIQLLLLSSENERLQFSIDHLDKMIVTLMETDVMKKRIQMNGHFKNIIPPSLT